MQHLQKLLKKNSLTFLLLSIIGLITYGVVIPGPFLFDDNLLIEHNQLIRSLKNIPQFFIANTQTGAGIEGSNFYRPLQNLTYALTYSLFQLKPHAYHLVSIFIHIANAYLLFQLLTKLKLNRTASFLGASLFLVHPITTEAISYVSGVADPQALFFLLLGFISYLSLQKPTPGNITKVVGFFTLALISKESAITFFPLLILLAIYQWDKFTPAQKQIQKYLLPGLLLLLIAYLTLKFTVLDFTGNTGLTGEKNIYTENLWIRINTFSSNIWEYFLMLVFPINLYLERPYIAHTDILSWRNIFGYTIIILGSIASLYSLHRKKIFLLSFGWFFTALAPLSGIIPLNAMYLEHWLYVPIIGIIIFITHAHHHSPKKFQKTFLIILSIAIILFSTRSIIRNTEWADPIKFYQNELRHNPDSSRIINNLAMKYDDQGQYQKAIKLYQKSLKLRNTYPQTYHNLGKSYQSLQQYKKAEQNYFQALKLSPGFHYSYTALHDLYTQTNSPKREKLEAFLKEAQKGIAQEAFQKFLELEKE